MAGEWDEVRLGDLSEVITKGTTPTSLGYRFTEDGINFVKSESVTFDGWIDRSKFARVDAETHAALKRSQLKEGDVLFSMAGVYIGKTAVVPRDILPANTNQAVGIVRLDQTRAHPRFIDYFLRNPSYNLFLNNLVSQSAQPNLNLAEIRNLPISLPPLPEQKAIATVLGALDDKIELNRRMNATLEAMARALFQSWFVDFDPVRAKLDGRQPPGLDLATVALFPSAFQDSVLGPVPHGWNARRLPDAIEVNPRRSLKGGTIAPYLDMKNLPTQGHSAEEVIDREFSSGTKFQNGDTLLARITPCLENGKTGYVDFLEDGQIGWGSTEYIVLAPKSPLPAQFGYFLARSEALRSHAIQNMTGTSGRQRVPSECFNSFFLAIPPVDIARRFDELTAPLMAKIKANSIEARTLATLRDTLLPKLLSGELSVNPQMLEEAADFSPVA